MAIRKVYRQLMLLTIGCAVLLSIYIMLGRLMMPLVSGYSAYFEGRLVEYTGVPISIDSLSGSFIGLNPQLGIDGLRLSIGAAAEDQEAPALVFESAIIIVDVLQSIWQRRWILEDFAVETLEINITQSEDGSWQLAGLADEDGSQMDFGELFQSLQRISLLNLKNVAITFFTNEGTSFSLVNGTAAIFNEGESHFLHVDANLGTNAQQIALSLEIFGNELSEITGMVHAAFPKADYSEIFSGQPISTLDISQLIGGLTLWIEIKDGQFSRGVSEFELEKLAFQKEQTELIEVNDMTGASSFEYSQINDAWEFAFSDISLDWADHVLQPFNVSGSYGASDGISLVSDQIDLALFSQLALDAGFLSGEAVHQVESFRPQGELSNLQLSLPLAGAVDKSVRLKANIRSGELLSVGSSPSVKGLNGYLEVIFALDSQLATGFLEVESEEFSINLPNIFSQFWDYNYVNGRLNFQADLSEGQKIELVSSLVIAESEAIDGRVMFSLTNTRSILDERNSYLELIVGAYRADASFKSLYLPDGPNVKESTKNTMEFLDEAILGGNIESSGVIFRGNSSTDSPDNEKTFQSYFALNDGVINFSEDWPRLENLSGYVTTNDGDVDISVELGKSLSLEMSDMTGHIRRNEKDENWLEVKGQVTGETSEGLSYLMDIPVGDGFKSTVLDWQAQGDFLADLEIEIPLNLPDLDVAARLKFALEDNILDIPEFSLSFEELSGPVIFDTKTGVEKTELDGVLFGLPVSLQIFSESDSGQIQRFFVSADGSARQEELSDWSMQSDFVKILLSQMNGVVNYAASLLVDQSQELTSNFLTIRSSLQGSALSLPPPFGKNSASTLPLNIELKYGDEDLISGTLGEKLSFVLDLGSLNNNGIVYVGDDDIDLTSLLKSDVKGVAIFGNLDKIKLEDWIGLIADLNQTGSVAAGLDNRLAFVDISTDIFEFYDQEFLNVNIRIERDELSGLWVATLVSESVQGTVSIPIDSNDYVDIDLDYLRLPGEEADGIVAGGSTRSALFDNQNESLRVAERLDPLVSIDPRDLPPLIFSTDEFSVGDRSYGSWQFTLNPSSTGASFTDLVFDFRGLRLGMDGPYVDGSEIDEYAAGFAPDFFWSFDGVEHSSALTGIIYADDISEVLTANGYSASIESEDAIFFTDVSWPGSPAFFSGSDLSGEIDIDIDNGRFQQGSGGQGALRLISILNFDAIMRRARLSDDLVRTGFAFDEIEAQLSLDTGRVQIEDRLTISGPSSLYQITGELNLREESILGEMYVTLPVSDNIPWLGLLTANLPLAVGAYLLDQIFGDQVDSLTSAVYSLDGPWENLEPEFKQAFGSPEE
ncbi:DUF3971 domain-containing protein [Gammaproteobacteria bacterium]|nr:DUF3971 domain-containing protein [Gammaproteobacteria bacterium]